MIFGRKKSKDDNTLRDSESFYDLDDYSFSSASPRIQTPTVGLKTKCATDIILSQRRETLILWTEIYYLPSHLLNSPIPLMLLDPLQGKDTIFTTPTSTHTLPDETPSLFYSLDKNLFR